METATDVAKRDTCPETVLNDKKVSERVLLTVNNVSTSQK